jgi:RHS repeat-associated protein
LSEIYLRYTNNNYTYNNVGNTLTIKGNDMKGNMTQHSMTKNERYLCWTEDNRLQGFMDNFNTAYYNYDASGERNMKITGKTHQTTQNGQPVYIPMLEEPTLYTNGLITLNSKGYTKHYYTEGTRVCSKIGGGFASATYDPLFFNVHPIMDDWASLFKKLEEGLIKTFDMCLGNDPIIKFQDKIFHSVKNELGRHDPEPAFYFLTDHLGSSSYITNDNGQVTQTMAYTPFGEWQVDMVNSNPTNPNGFATTYKFSGKEKDEETGFGYFGARYYYDYLSIWLSTDPLADKYPSLSPYVYCANNPIKLIDPNGMEIVNAHEKQKNEAETKMKQAQEALNSFGGNKKSNEYKSLQNQYKSAKTEYNSSNKAYQKAQKAISRLEKYNPELYNKLDNLYDENNNEVDIYVEMVKEVKDDKGNILRADGLATTGVNKDNHFFSKYGENTARIQLLDNRYNDAGQILSHEGGHCVYNIPNWSKYAIDPNRSYDGHGERDPSGDFARKMELVFIANKNKGR